MKKRILASVLAASVAAAAMSVSAFAELGASDYTDDTATITVVDADQDDVSLVTEDGVVLDVATADLPEGVTEVTFIATTLGTDIPEVEFIADLLNEHLSISETGYAINDVLFVDALDMALFDQDGNAIENADFNVSVPTDNEDVNAVFYTDGETVEVYRAAYANGYVEFTVPHFSTYVLAVVPEEVLDEIVTDSTDSAEVTIDADGETDDTTDDAATDGDKNVATGVALAVVPAAIAGAAVVISRKRK